MSPFEEIEHEMAYTTYDDSCREPHVADDGDLRECRRSKHVPHIVHASGYGSGLLLWG